MRVEDDPDLFVGVRGGRVDNYAVPGQDAGAHDPAPSGATVTFATIGGRFDGATDSSVAGRSRVLMYLVIGVVAYYLLVD